MLFLKSSLFHYLKLTQQETDALMESFRLTDPGEHDYLTKAQAVWMSLLERNELSKAKAFMLDVYRVCPQSAREAVQEILDETYGLAGGNQRPTGTG